MKLDNATVAKLTLPPGRSELIVFDERLKGFGVRLRAGGKRTWIVQYRVGKKQRRRTIGPVNMIMAARAYAAAERDLAEVRLGEDPQAKKKEDRSRADMSLISFAARFLQYKKGRLKARSYEQLKSHLAKHWAPLWDLSIHKITRSDIDAGLRKITTERGPFAANRARASLSIFFSWAVKEGIVDTNPVIATNRPTDERARDRVLSDAELIAIWESCRDDDYGRIIRLLILTGQRRDEVGSITRSEINLAQGKWNIPPDRTSNGRAHEVPLSNLAIDILEGAMALKGGQSIFGNGARGRSNDTRGFSGWSKAKLALDQRIEEVTGITPYWEARDAPQSVTTSIDRPVEMIFQRPGAWRVHDIRRTVAVRLADLGVPPHVIEAILNHIRGHNAGMAGAYNHELYAAEKRQALDLWAAQIEAIAAEGGSSVLSLKARP